MALPNAQQQQVEPKLVIKEIQDIYVRKNFERIMDYSFSQNQLLNFKFFELTFAASVANYKHAHGLGTLPQDILVTKIVGSGSVRFNHGLSTTTHLNLTVSGPCRIRFFVGTYWNNQNNAPGLVTDFTQYYPTAPTSSGSSNVIVDEETGEITAVPDYLDITSAQPILPENKIINADASGGAFTVTVYGATTDYLNNQIRIKKTDTTFNAVTITAGSVSTTLNTQGETVILYCIGTDWRILSREIPSFTVRTTLTITATSVNPTKGTPTSDILSYTRRGKFLYMQGSYYQSTGGTTGTGTLTIPVPSGLTIDTLFAEASSTKLGDGYLWPGTGADTPTQVYVQSSTSLFFLIYSGGGFSTASVSALDLSNANARIRFDAEIPINGWNY